MSQARSIAPMLTRASICSMNSNAVPEVLNGALFRLVQERRNLKAQFEDELARLRQEATA